MSRGRAAGDGGDGGDRLVSLDAARGLCLLAVVSGGLGLSRLGRGWLAGQWRPADGVGCTAWDALPAAFLLLAGVALAYAAARRAGQAWPRRLGHALLRTGLLLGLGLYLESYRANRPTLEPRGDLPQIALAGLAGFLLLPLGARGQALAAGFLLVAHTAAHHVHGRAAGHDPWLSAHPLGEMVDRWFGLAPHRDGLALLNVLPATALVLLGAALGELLRGGMPPGRKLALLLALGGGAVVVGWALAGGGGPLPLGWPTPAPLLPRLWTASYVLLAGGGAVLVLAGGYAVADALGWHVPALPLAVVGRNSLVLFLAFVLFREWAFRSVHLALPDSRPWVAAYRPLLAELLVGLVFWLLGFWLYRRRIFVTV